MCPSDLPKSTGFILSPHDEYRVSFPNLMPFNQTETKENVQDVSASIFVNLCCRHMHSCQLAVISFFVCYSTLRKVCRICLELTEFRSYWLISFCHIVLVYADNSSFLVYFARPTGKEFYIFQYFHFLTLPLYICDINKPSLYFPLLNSSLRMAEKGRNM